MTREMFDIAQDALEKLRVSVDRCSSDSPGLSMKLARFLELAHCNHEIDLEEYGLQLDISNGLAADFLVNCSCSKKISLVKEK
jgi:hypothetical protein